MSRVNRLFVSIGVAFGLLALSIVQAQNGPSPVIAEGKQAAGQGANAQRTVFKGVPFEIVLAQAVKAEAKPKDAVKRATKAKVAVKAAQAKAVFAVPAPAAANLDPLIQQFSQQLRPILRGEFHLVRSVCALSKDQRMQLAREGEKTLKETAKKFAELQQNPQMVIINNRRSHSPNPRKMIQDGIVSSAKAHLSAADLKLYMNELEKRNSSRKDVTIRNLVAKLDQDLVLTAVQREKITESLTTNWNEDWCPSVEMFTVFNQFFPFIPDQFVTPHLNLTQKKVWDGTQKQQLNFWGVFGFVGNMVDDVPLDDELEEARKAAEPPPGGGAMIVAPGPFNVGIVHAIEVRVEEVIVPPVTKEDVKKDEPATKAEVKKDKPAEKKKGKEKE